MASDQIVATIHKDYLPFIKLATPEELSQFVMAQICHSTGEELPQLVGMAKALFEAHMSLIERLEESSRKKSEAGRMGGNPILKQIPSDAKQTEAEVNQCLSTENNIISSDKAEVKQTEAEVKPNTISYSVTNTNTVTESDTDTKEKPARLRAKPPAAACDVLSDLDSGVQDAFREFLKFRVKIKRPMTDRGIRSALKKLQELSGEDPDRQIAHIDKALEHGWLTFYPLNDNENGGAANGRRTGGVQPHNPRIRDPDTSEYGELARRHEV